MTTYYFHLRAAPRVELDADGRELPDLSAAKRHAIEIAAGHADDPAPWRIEIADAAGQYLASVDRDGVVAD